jgi:hypothetical protein
MLIREELKPGGENKEKISKLRKQMGLVEENEVTSGVKKDNEEDDDEIVPSLRPVP